MSYAVRKSDTFDQVLRSAGWKAVLCTDPCHEHKTSALQVCGVSYCKHRVSVVADGDQYSAQIDGNPISNRDWMTYMELLEYVEKQIKELNS